MELSCTRNFSTVNFGAVRYLDSRLISATNATRVFTTHIFASTFLFFFIWKNILWNSVLGAFECAVSYVFHASLRPVFVRDINSAAFPGDSKKGNIKNKERKNSIVVRETRFFFDGKNDRTRGVSNAI